MAEFPTVRRARVLSPAQPSAAMHGRTSVQGSATARGSDARRQFASDTWAPMCPEALAALIAANTGHAEPYGDDPWTAQAADQVRVFFDAPQAQMFFVPTGTASNALALASLCQSYHSVICHQTAHIETDECGAPEFASNGTKLLTVPGAHGRLTPESVERMVLRRQDIHYPKPKVVSLTQATEVGTVYSITDIAAISTVARRHGLHVHLDGARFFNALAHLKCKPAELTWQAGVDVVCLGGTKNGLGVGEIVVFFEPQRAEDFAYRVKQAGHLPAKLRYVAAPWTALLGLDAHGEGVAVRNARAANARAQQLARGFLALGLPPCHPIEANEVFVKLSDPLVDYLHAHGWHFYGFIGDGGWRFVASWDHTSADVDQLLTDVQAGLRA